MIDGLRETKSLIEHAVNPCGIARFAVAGAALASAPFPAIRILSRIGGRFGILPEEHEDLADMLNRLRFGPPANLLEDRFALGTIGAGDAHLDQLVAFQAAVDFREDRARQSSSADQDDRIERVRPRLQLAPPGG